MFLKSFFWATWAFLVRDFQFHSKNPERFLSIFLFGLALMIASFFSFRAESLENFSQGVFWLSFCFITLLAFHRLLLLDEITGFRPLFQFSPNSLSVLFLAKIISAWLQLMLLHSVLCLFVGAFFDAHFFHFFWPIFKLLACINFGQTVVGVLVSEHTFSLKHSEFLFPILFLPLTLPLFICGIVLMENALQTQGVFFSSAWWQLLFLYNVLFFGVGLAWNNFFG